MNVLNLSEDQGGDMDEVLFNPTPREIVEHVLQCTTEASAGHDDRSLVLRDMVFPIAKKISWNDEDLEREFLDRLCRIYTQKKCQFDARRAIADLLRHFGVTEEELSRMDVGWGPPSLERFQPSGRFQPSSSPQPSS